MKCELCEIAGICDDPAQMHGGCDMDGADDFDSEEEARAEYYELCADIERDEGGEQ